MADTILKRIGVAIATKIANVKAELLSDIADEESARISADNTLTTNLASEASTRLANDNTLQTNINTEKGRINNILSASEADKDSFAEIVTLINSVDTENDTAFSGYVISNNAALDSTNAEVATKLPKAGGTMTGTITIGTSMNGAESSFQSQSTLHSGQPFLNVPWVYTSQIEANERGTAGTGIALGADGKFNPLGDTVSIHTAGSTRLTVQSTGVTDFSATPTVNGTTVTLSTHLHDDRYYTETEADARFVNVTGDSMSGSLLMTGSYNGLYWGNQYNDVNAHDGHWSYIRQKVSSGELEIGSDDKIDIYETDSRVLAVEISTNNKTLDAKGYLKEAGVALSSKYLGITAKAVDSDLLDGYNSAVASTANTVAIRNSDGDINTRLFRSEYDVTNPTIGYIMTQVDTANNNYIRPTTPTQFRTAIGDSYYLGITAKAVDSNLLDGLDSTQFLRTDADTSVTGADLIVRNDAGSSITGAGQQNGLQVFQPTVNADATMSFHVGGDTAVHFGLDGVTAKLSVGGWSMGDNSYAIYHEGNKPTLDETGATAAFVNVTGDTMSGDLILTATDTETRLLQVGKSTNGSQASGAIEVTQDGDHGGGMLYNGDGTPGFATGEGSDRISFYRNAAGSRSVVFGYGYNSDLVTFVGPIVAAGSIKVGTDTVFHEGFHPNADTLTTARNIALSGDVSGNVNFNGSANVNITTTVANDSHTHDTRYFTESESDSRFVNVTGDTMTGNLQVTMSSSTNTDFVNFRSSETDQHAAISYMHGDQAVYGSQGNLHFRHYTASTEDKIAITANSIVGEDNVYEGTTKLVDKYLLKSHDTTLTLSGDVSGSATFTNMGNATLSVVVVNDSHTHHTSYYTKAQSDTKIADLVSSAPATLDTLNELAAALGDDPNFATTIASQIGTKLNANAKAVDSNLLDGLDSSQFLRSDVDDIMSSTLTFVNTATGVNWSMNTDGASIRFYNTSDADANSRLEFNVLDNSNEDFLFTATTGTTTTDLLRISPDGGQTGLKFRGNTVWHQGNDGSGSGLDADKLDNFESSQFLRSDANDTLTGSLLWSGDVQDYNGLYWGAQYKDNAAHDGAWAYIRRHELGGGQIELGSDDAISFYETDSRVLAVHISTNAMTLDAKGHLKEAGVALSSKYLGITDKAANSDKLDSLDSSQFSRRIDLSGQVQVASYRKSVIALVNLDNGDINRNSIATGMITFNRSNGLDAPVRLEIAMEKRYNSVGANYTALVQSGNSFGDNIQYIKFLYGGNWYGGIAFDFTAAEHHYVRFHGETNFGIFGLDYYDTQSGVLNAEVADSISTSDMSAETDFFFNNNTIWHSGNDGSGSGLDADLLDGLGWDSAGKNVRGTEVYADQWFRNYTTGKGLYSEPHAMHFYADADNYWNISGGGASNGLRFRDNHNGTIRGYVHADNTGSIGFTDAGGSWAIKHTNDQGTYFFTDGATKEFSVGIDTVSGGYGTVATHTTKSGYGGYSIANRVVFMHDHSNTWGIYNDVNDEWMLYGTLNAGVKLRYNNVDKLESTLDGATTTGNHTITGMLKTDEIRTKGGDGVKINVGESYTVETNVMASEFLYVNAESGIQLNTSPDNWATGWAGRNTIILGNNGITVNGDTVWHQGNDGPGSGLNADLLDGYNLAEVSTANTVAMRNSSGDINARLFRSEYDSTNATIGYIMTQVNTASDNYIRPSTPTQFRAAVTDAHYLGKTSKATDSELLDGHDSGVFERWTGTYSATCAAGWVTIANFTDNRGHAEFYVWDLDSSDHGFIHIEATRSFDSTSISILNTGGHTRRITGARFLGDSDTTYGNKKLQVYVTTSSLYYMRSKNSDKLIGFNSVSPCTPVLEGTPSGYSQVCITENFSHINGGMGSSGIGYFGSTVYESGGALAGRYLGLTAKAADSNLLDGIDSTGFLRANSNSEVAIGNTVQINNVAGASIGNATGYALKGLEIRQNTANADAGITFHVGGDYACYMGLDGGTNKMSIGGWSMGAASYAIYHEGNPPTLAQMGASSDNRYVQIIAIEKDTVLVDSQDLLGDYEIPFAGVALELRAKTNTGTCTVEFINNGNSMGQLPVSDGGNSTTTIANATIAQYADMTFKVLSASGTGLTIMMKIRES